MSKAMAAVVVGAALAMAQPAWAHTDEYLDTVAAPHGGQLRMSGPYHLELVAKDKEITVYVTDHGDSKIATQGGEGKANILLGKAKTTIKLEPAGDNVFKGTGDFTLKPASVVVVFVKLPEHEAYSARFTPLKPKSKVPAKGAKSAGDHAHDHSHHDHGQPAHHDGHDDHQHMSHE